MNVYPAPPCRMVPWCKGAHTPAIGPATEAVPFDGGGEVHRLGILTGTARLGGGSWAFCKHVRQGSAHKPGLVLGGIESHGQGPARSGVRDAWLSNPSTLAAPG